MNEPRTLRAVATEAANELAFVPIIVRPVSIGQLPLVPIVYAICGLGIIAGAIGFGVKVIAKRITS